tara:strand:- start:111 stop:680 length:570 start_codon:yes stop_codon:yes gene_type:complete
MGLTLSTAPTEPVVSVGEVRQHSRISTQSDDNWIQSRISAATNWAQLYTNRQFVSGTYTWNVDTFPSVFEVPFPPLSSVTSIKYYDTTETQQTLAASQYTVITDREPGEIHEAFNVTWPSTQDIPNAVEVIYVAGYGAAASVPDEFKEVVCLIVGHWYENREAGLIGTVSKQLELTVDDILGMERVVPV